MGKYLFFDIDGTLLGKSRRITEKTKQAIQRARKNGHKIFICTGRVPAFIVGDVNDIEVDGIVSGVGSFVEIGGQYIFEHYMESQLTEKVVMFECASMEINMNFRKRLNWTKISNIISRLLWTA